MKIYESGMLIEIAKFLSAAFGRPSGPHELPDFNFLNVLYTFSTEKSMLSREIDSAILDSNTGSEPSSLVKTLPK